MLTLLHIIFLGENKFALKYGSHVFHINPTSGVLLYSIMDTNRTFTSIIMQTDICTVYIYIYTV